MNLWFWLSLALAVLFVAEIAFVQVVLYRRRYKRKERLSRPLPKYNGVEETKLMR